MISIELLGEIGFGVVIVILAPISIPRTCGLGVEGFFLRLITRTTLYFLGFEVLELLEVLIFLATFFTE